MTFRAIERRDLRVGNVWEKDAQHHPQHMRRRLSDGGRTESRFQQAGAHRRLLTQDVEELTLTCGEIVRRAHAMRDIHAISPLR